MIEFNNGIANFLGAIIGASLNQIGDYYLPFLFFTGLSILALPAISMNLPKSSSNNVQEVKSQPEPKK